MARQFSKQVSAAAHHPAARTFLGASALQVPASHDARAAVHIPVEFVYLAEQDIAVAMVSAENAGRHKSSFMLMKHHRDFEKGK